jgi:ADP-ribose pyrophosphatase
MTLLDKPVGRSLGWHTFESSHVYECPWFRVRQDTISLNGGSGGVSIYVEHPGAVFIVPVLPDGRVLLIRSYRYSLDAFCWEVPAGTLADRGNASPEMVAIDELRQEVGATCRELRNLGKLYLGNGFANYPAYFFLAIDTVQTTEPATEVLEHISEVSVFSFDEIINLMKDGTIHDGDSALALFLGFQACSPCEFRREENDSHE